MNTILIVFWYSHPGDNQMITIYQNVEIWKRAFLDTNQVTSFTILDKRDFTVFQNTFTVVLYRGYDVTLLRTNDVYIVKSKFIAYYMICLEIRTIQII